MVPARPNATLKRHDIAGTVAVLFFLTLVHGVLAAQDESLSDQPGSTSQARQYVPPPAWKSVEVGDFYLRRKNYRGALSRYQEAAAIDPYYAPAYLGLGKCYEKMGLKQKALDSYKKYLDDLPSEKDALNAKGVQKAIERLERQLARRSKTAGAARAPH
ncbi:MAG TPA: tetratricopeptide repeat protein [Terriglobia bacterium]|nr:tetratricopeptide repeat protein [Terriglobia bacterium]